MSKQPLSRRASFIAAFVMLGILVLAVSGGSKPGAYSCKLGEDEIRKLWVTSTVQARDEADRTRITALMVKNAETLCEEQRDAKIVPLPSELQKLAR